jgi:hypothetical protein
MLSKIEYVDNLRRIYVAHTFYRDADNDDKERIYEVCGELFDMIEVSYRDGDSDSVHDSGLDRSFGTLLLLYGDGFLKKQFGCDDLNIFIDGFIK